MRKKKRNLIILSGITILALFITSSCCPLFSPPGLISDEETEAEEAVDDSMDSDSSESEESTDQSVDDSESEATETEQEEVPVEQPPFSFAESFDFPPLASYDEFTTGLGLDDEEKQKIEVHLDVVGNNVWAGGPGFELGGYTEYTDIVFYALGTITDKRDPDSPPFNTQFTCGSYNWEVPTWVVCPQGFNAEGINEWHMLTMGLLDDSPFMHESHYGTFTVALDPDNDPANNHVPLPEWPWDHYKNTDYWPIVRYDPTTHEWTAMTYRSDWSADHLNYFTVFYKNTVTFYLPVQEFPEMYFGGRFALEWTVMDRSPESYGADVSQGDPDQPLFTWNNSESIKDDTGYAHYLPSGYAFCSPSGCKMNRDEIGKDLGFEAIDNLDHWCECTGCTNQPECSCKMFRSEIDLRFGAPSVNPKDYTYYADSNQRTLLDPFYSYRCFCVQGGQ